ncbi:PQQ-binding-like beta-propeller repeat protein [uncultured Alsobacter sp.]|uniref:pyrroloquinoline quinone-dependent dehydrogenase n=1 Tax=uncultured Alsobacter sp. TaxID=1748258 RepID=UPI0026013023|nr:PQQ-binding-like beta-propeller repeat protein [uncultured Alsobacter sp.]
MIAQALLRSTILATSLTVVTATMALAQTPAANNLASRVTTVTDDMLKNPPDGDWLQWRRTYDGWGYSPLDQINKSNVKNLKLVWSWGMTPGGTTQETPLVHDGVMYIQNSTHLIQAINAATGQLLWQYQHRLPEGVLPNGVRNKAIYGDNLYVATRDAHILAINAKTGKLVWDQQVADVKKGWGYTSGPLVANGVLIQGMTNCSNAQPGGCFFSGHDTKTGKELWRVNTIARGDTPEGNSWNGVPVEARYGASAWIAGSYDVEQNLFFAGVGQPYPWPAVLNGLLPKNADAKYTNNALYTDSTLAIDPTSGKLKWYHQYLQNDTLDLDYVYERLILDLPVNGQTRKTVVTTGKLGIIEAIDRTNGEWLWHKETVPQNVVQSIDPKTGAKTINPAVIPQIGQTTFNCPADPGGRAWQATSYSPKTRMLYMPTVEFCSNTVLNPLDPGQVYTGGGLATYNRVPVPNSDGKIGQVRAVKLDDRTDAWMYRQYAPVTTSTLPTGGGLVFVGTLDRKLLAFDDTTGQLLWTSPTFPNSIESFPISYMADGKQYIAVVTNWSSGLGRLKLITPDIALPAHNPHEVYVFAVE